MGYMIQYNPEENKRYPSRVSVRSKKVWRIIFIAVCAALVILAAKHKSALRRWLLPGDPTVTEAAINGLVTDIRDGATGGEAIAAFYREIISHAEG